MSGSLVNMFIIQNNREALTMASKKKDDDLMFGDRLQPGPAPFPPAPGPIPPGPIPPGPIPPVPPPGPYPTCQFIDERVGILRNEHTAIKSAVLEVKNIAEESSQALNDVKDIATTGFAAVDNAVGGVKTDLTQKLTTLSGKVDGVSDDISGVETNVTQAIAGEARLVKESLTSIDGKVDNISTNTVPGAVQALQEYIRGKKDDVLDGQTEIRNHIERDVRNALGLLRDSDEQATRKPIWPKIDDAEQAARAAQTAAEGSVAKVTDIQNTLGVNERGAGESMYKKVTDIKNNHTAVMNGFTTLGEAIGEKGEGATLFAEVRATKAAALAAAQADDLDLIAQSVNIIRGAVAGEGSNPIAVIQSAVTNAEYGNQALGNLLTNQDYGLRAIMTALSALTTLQTTTSSIVARLDAIDEKLADIDASLDALNEQVSQLVPPEGDEGGDEGGDDPQEPEEP